MSIGELFPLFEKSLKEKSWSNLFYYLYLEFEIWFVIGYETFKDLAHF